MTNSYPLVLVVQIVGVLLVLLAAFVPEVVGIAADHLVQEAVVLPLLDQLLSFFSLSINPTSFMSMYLYSLFIM